MKFKSVCAVEVLGVCVPSPSPDQSCRKVNAAGNNLWECSSKLRPPAGQKTFTAKESSSSAIIIIIIIKLS